jgi:hypothetical protein
MTIAVAAVEAVEQTEAKKKFGTGLRAMGTGLHSKEISENKHGTIGRRIILTAVVRLLRCPNSPQKS